MMTSTWAAATATAAPESWPCLGTVKPRHAKEIASSNWSVGCETLDRDFAIYKNFRAWLGPLGVKKARIQAGWAKTEKARGIYDWAWLDEMIPDMVEQGVKPWVCLCYGNSLYDGSGTGLGSSPPSRGETLAAWLRFVDALVERYGKYVDEWELWNEPRAGAENYVPFFIATAEKLRARQPKAVILGISCAGINFPLVDDVLAALQRENKLGLLTGGIHEIPAAQWSARDGRTKFTDFPLGDAPVLIAERALIPLQAGTPQQPASSPGTTRQPGAVSGPETEVQR